MVKEIQIKKEKYFFAIISVLDCFLNLTMFEKKILSSILNNNFETLTEANRLVIQQELKKSSFNLNNYIKKMKDKGILTLKDNFDILEINPNLKSLIYDIIDTGQFHVNFIVVDE